MSMEYCYKHDIERDTDYEVFCPECEMEKEQAMKNKNSGMRMVYGVWIGWCALVFMFLCTFGPLIYIASKGV